MPCTAARSNLDARRAKGMNGHSEDAVLHHQNLVAVVLHGVGLVLVGNEKVSLFTTLQTSNPGQEKSVVPNRSQFAWFCP